MSHRKSIVLRPPPPPPPSTTASKTAAVDAAAAVEAANRNSVSLDGDDLNLPKRPWNANLKAYTKQEPSIPWYKRQSRTPSWVTDPPQQTKELIPNVFHASKGGNNRHSTGGLTKLRSGRASNQNKQIKLHDIRNSNLFRKISTNQDDGEMFEWSIHGASSPMNSVRNSANLSADGFKLHATEENHHPNNNHVEESKGLMYEDHKHIHSSHGHQQVKAAETTNTIDLSPIQSMQDNQMRKQQQQQNDKTVTQHDATKKPADEKKSMFNTLKNMIRRPSSSKLAVDEELQRQFDEEEQQLNAGHANQQSSRNSESKPNRAIEALNLNQDDDLRPNPSHDIPEEELIFHSIRSNDDMMSPIRGMQDDDINLSREPSFYDASFVIDEDADFSSPTASQRLASSDVEFNMGSVYDEEPAQLKPKLMSKALRTQGGAELDVDDVSPIKFEERNALAKKSHDPSYYDATFVLDEDADFSSPTASQRLASSDVEFNMGSVYDEEPAQLKPKPKSKASNAQNSEVDDVSPIKFEERNALAKKTRGQSPLENEIVDEVITNIDMIYEELHSGQKPRPPATIQPRPLTAAASSSHDSHAQNSTIIMNLSDSTINSFSPGNKTSDLSDIRDFSMHIVGVTNQSAVSLDMGNIYEANSMEAKKLSSNPANNNVKDVSPIKYTQMNDMVWNSPIVEPPKPAAKPIERGRSKSRGASLEPPSPKPEVKRSLSRGASLRSLFSFGSQQTVTSEPTTISRASSNDDVANPIHGSTSNSGINMGDIYDDSLTVKNFQPTTSSDYFAPKFSPLKQPRKSVGGHHMISPADMPDIHDHTSTNENIENGQADSANNSNNSSNNKIDQTKSTSKNLKLNRPQSVKLDMGQVYEEDIQIDGDLLDSDVAASLAHTLLNGEHSPLKFAQANEFREELQRSRTSTNASSVDIPSSNASVTSNSKTGLSLANPSKTSSASSSFNPLALLQRRLQSETTTSKDQPVKDRPRNESNPENFTFDMNELRNEFITRSRAGSNNSMQSSVSSISRRSLSTSPSIEPRSKGSLSIESVSRSLVSNRMHHSDDGTYYAAKKYKRASLPPAPLSSTNILDLSSRFDLIKECMICNSDLSKLSLHEHIRHIYGCAETCQASLSAALTHRNYHPIDPAISLPQEHVRRLDINRPQPLTFNLKRENSTDSTGSAFGTPLGTPMATPHGSMRAIKVTMDTGTQTTGAFVDDSLTYDGYPSTPRTPLNPIVEQHKRKMTSDITSKVNKINEHRTQLQSQLLSNDDDIDLYNVYSATVQQEIFPKPSMALQDNKAARVKEEKAKRFNLVGPSLAGVDGEDKDLNRMRQELTELLAKQSEIRVKERVLRSVIKKNLAKAKIDALPEDEDEDEDSDEVVEGDTSATSVAADGTSGDLEFKSPEIKSPRVKRTPRASAKKKKPEEVDVDKVSSTEKSPRGVEKPEIEVPDHLKKFDLMLKRGVPVAAVAAKMTMEGVTNEDQQVVMKTLEPPKAPDAEIPEHLKKYQLMLKRGVPVPAVIAKMTMDKITPEDQKLVLKGPDEPVLPPVEVELPEHLKKYQLMLKRGVPPPAVVAKMNLEGISAEDQKLVMKSLETPLSPGLKKDEASASANELNTGPKLIGLFWDVVEKEKIDNHEKNVWKAISASKPAALLRDAEWDNLVAMFSKKEVGKKKAEIMSSSSKDIKSVGTRKVLDFARSVSISIVLSVFKSHNMDVDLICDSINNMNIHIIQIDDALRVKDILPTEQEVKQFADIKKTKNFKIDDLVEVEQAMFKLCQVDRLKEKIIVIIFLLTWNTSIHAFTRKCEILARTTETACSSEGLSEIFHTILSIGNSLNAGTAKGNAHGYKLSSLSKLNQTKSSNNIHSVLDFLVQTLYGREKLGDKNSTRALNVDEELQEGINMSKAILMSDLELEMKSFETNMRQFHDILQREWDDPESRNPHMSELKDQHKNISQALQSSRELIERAKRDVKEFESFYFEVPDSCQKMFKDFDEFVTSLKKSKEKYQQMQRLSEKAMKVSNPLAQKSILPSRRKSSII